CGAVQTGFADHRLNAVVEEQIREQEEQGLRKVAEFPECARELRNGAAHRACALTATWRRGAAQCAQSEHRDKGERAPPDASREQADTARQGSVEPNTVRG